MGSRAESTESKIAAACLIGFAFLLISMILLEAIMNVNIRGTLETDFLQKSSLSFIMPYFLIYLVMGGLGLYGVVGLAQVYGSSHRKITAEVVKLAALGTFAINYWLWSAMWIVQHKITLLTEIPTNPEPWVLRAFDAADAFWSLAGWGGLGPSVVLFLGMAWLLSRGARLLPRAASILFLVVGIVQLLLLIYIGVHGFGVSNTSGGFPFIADLTMAVGRIAAFLLAGAALFTEKGIFVRTEKLRTRVR